jgi:hypothetical protein
MRFFEISSGFRLPVSEEEQEILSRAIDDRQLPRGALGEREQEVARLMVSRGLLNRHRDDEGKVFYEPNDTTDLWRF